MTGLTALGEKGHQALTLWVQNMKIPSLPASESLPNPELFCVLDEGCPPPCQAPFHSSTQTAALATPEAARGIIIIMQTEEKALMNTPGTWGSYRQGFLGSWIHTALSGRREEEGGWVSDGLSLWAHRYFLWGMLQPKAYRSGASKYRDLGQAPWIAGWQYCKDNFFSGLEMYFLHNLSLLYILSCYFPSFLSYSFSLFFNAPSSSSFRDI